VFDCTCNTQNSLLEGAVNVSITDEDGMTCLHILAYKTRAICLV